MSRGQSIKRAMDAAKEYYGECIFCGDKNIQGCHILPRGESQYAHLADVKFNIIAACDLHHKHLDAGLLGFMSTRRARRPWARVRMIRRNCQSDIKCKVTAWLDELRKTIKGGSDVRRVR